MQKMRGTSFKIKKVIDNKAISIFVLFIICFLITGCFTSRYHEKAETDKPLAAELIKRLKNDTLLIVLPTFSKKEIQLKKLIKNDPSKKEQANQRLLTLYADRELKQEAMINSFYDNYTFSYFLFIPDSLVTDFESGVSGAYFLNDYLEIDPSIQYSNHNPIKFIQRFEKEWHIMEGKKMVPNPFPNNYVYIRKSRALSGIVTLKGIHTDVVKTFQSRFEKYYAKKSKDK